MRPFGTALRVIEGGYGVSSFYHVGERETEIRVLKRSLARRVHSFLGLTRIGRLRNHIIAMVKNMVGGGDDVDGDTPLMEPGARCSLDDLERQALSRTIFGR